MKVGKNKVVSLTYELRLDGKDGDLIQKVVKDKPFVYLFGVGGLLPKFEENLDGLEVGGAFSFGLNSDEGYGEYDEANVMDINKSIFEVDGVMEEDMLVEGNMIPMEDQDGNVLNGTILEITPDTVKMDFNHPLAGQDLHFKGEIVEIREATTEEVEHGHAHVHGDEH